MLEDLDIDIDIQNIKIQEKIIDYKIDFFYLIFINDR